ncbi:MAG: aminotransferase class I/II-fold pyridoxal phosphate-dependent enzyme [Pseudonocardiaceae bacterium]|nr:aminotransferase class I/II-fold pyridoxal phosphate-dependent enzyme [Pseudonocardiaceae bacterium]
MTENWPTFRELLLPAVQDARGRRGNAVESALRDAIRSGRLAAHTRLPSSRDLAGQLGLARGTVKAVYEQLAAEGYLLARHGSGTRVAELGGGPALAVPEPGSPQRWRFDLRPGLPALAAFPRSEWLAVYKQALAELTDEELGYPDPAGHPALREELAGYLGRVRAVACPAGQILITNGAAEALSLIAGRLYVRGQRRIAVEDPSHTGQAELLAAKGLEPIGVPVDEDGIRVDELAKTGVRAVVVTSAHQFPLGVVLHPRRRHALLDWAREHDGLVIEDDYDAEHRYDRPALTALRSLDPERVAYVGSVSKVLAPAPRLGWLIPPAGLRDELVDAKRLHDLGCPSLPQAALARLLRTGGYDRHLRRTRKLYRARRDALVSALAEYLPQWRAVGVAAGLHVVVRLPSGLDDREVSRELASGGINAPALSGYAHSQPTFPGLVLGYAAIGQDRLRAAVREIAAITRRR